MQHCHRLLTWAFIRELLSEYLPYPILERCSNSAEDLIQPRFTPSPSTLSARYFAFQVQLKPYIYLSFLQMAHRAVTLVGGAATAHRETKTTGVAVPVLGKYYISLMESCALTLIHRNTAKCFAALPCILDEISLEVLDLIFLKL